VYKNVLRSG